MKTCRDIEPLVTPCVDGEANQEQEQTVRRHLDVCAPCQVDVAAQQTARSVLSARASALGETAPAGLKIRCESLVSSQIAHPGRRLAFPFPKRVGWPLALAATLVLAVAGALAYGVARPVEAAAAQLALDHVKCFALFDQPAERRAADVRNELRARHGWDIDLPDEAHAGGLRLVGGRRCIYLDGSVAHILYKKGTEPVSLFVLPPDTTLREGHVEVLGYSAVAFRRAGRTYVVLAHRPQADVVMLARVFK
ncbi:MAG: zf-HC2 domain-containing protein [Acidobacteriota bacterium]